MRASAALVIAVITGLSGPALAEEMGLTPQQIGAAFCLARLSGDSGPITGLLTAGLAAELQIAEAKNAAWEKANPGEKPPLGDGVPWSTYVDYASTCTVGTVDAKDTQAAVEIRYGFPEVPEADYSDWLTLAKVEVPALYGTAWRIDNVVFIEGGDMRIVLKDMLAVE
jgi:hypothetical protein